MWELKSVLSGMWELESTLKKENIFLESALSSMYRLEMAIKGKDRAKSIKPDIRGL